MAIAYVAASLENSNDYFGSSTKGYVLIFLWIRSAWNWQVSILGCLGLQIATPGHLFLDFPHTHNSLNDCWIPFFYPFMAFIIHAILCNG